MNRQKNDIKANRTFSTFGFARHTSQRFAKPKELNFNNPQTNYFIQTMLVCEQIELNTIFTTSTNKK